MPDESAAYLPEFAAHPTWWADGQIVLNGLVVDVGRWADRNFRRLDPDVDAVATTLGMVEEAGEVARAVLKRHQRIRGTSEEWIAEATKEVGDVVIKLADICYVLGIDFTEAVARRWERVRERDFVADPIGHGLPGVSAPGEGGSDG